MKTFVLQHIHTLKDGAEDVKFIGVYSSKEHALAAIKRLSKAPGFSKTKDGFCIDEYQLDQDHWADGFASDLQQDETPRKKPPAKLASSASRTRSAV